MITLPAEFVTPSYDGRGITNLSASLVRHFGGAIATPGLDADLLDDLLAGAQRVVLLVVDAVGHDSLANALAEGGGLARLLPSGRLGELTSVFPSTTTAALTSLWTGVSPAEHGLLGYRQWLGEYGVRANMISFCPDGFEKHGRDQLLSGGLDPDTFLAVPSVAQRLSAVGVPTHNLIYGAFAKSGLSRLQARGVAETRGFVGLADLWPLLRAQMASCARGLFVAYWHVADDLQHAYGPSSEALETELDLLGRAFERAFLDRLTPAEARDTLFLLTSDHGQMAARPERVVRLTEHPELAQLLAMPSTGDSRAAYLHCRQGCVAEATAYCREHLGEAFAVLDSSEALASGLFGPLPHAPRAAQRVGDLVLCGRGGYLYWDRPRDPDSLGRHGGLAPEEQRVPLLAARL